MPDELRPDIIELLMDGPKTRGELKKLMPGMGWPALEGELADMERESLIWRNGWHWAVTSETIARMTFRKVMGGSKPPDGEFGKFLREFHSSARLGATLEEAWVLARGRCG